jgi:hypothetical protein
MSSVRPQGRVARELRAAHEAMDRKERCLDVHGYGCDRSECRRAHSGPIIGLDRWVDDGGRA